MKDQEMDVYKRITIAYMTVRDALTLEGAVAIHESTINSKPCDVVEYKKPNVLYVGNEEHLAMRTEPNVYRHFEYRFGTNDVYFNGMRVIQVRLDSWLQVAYVEGVK